MSSSRIPLVLALLAGVLAAVPAASAQGATSRAVRVQGVCTQESTSKLKLSREDRGIEVEFEVDQNRNGVRGTSPSAGTAPPWFLSRPRHAPPAARSRSTA